MKLSTGAICGTRALLDVALHSSEGIVPLSEIARRHEISVPHPGHLIWPLVAAGIVRSTPGSSGGVSLLKSPAEIKLSEVPELLDGWIALYDYVPPPHYGARGYWHGEDVVHHERRPCANALGDGGENM